MMHSILISILLLLASSSFAATCIKSGTVCADSTPCKTISGVQVCLTDPAINATCWKYTDSYSCLAQPPVNYCAAIASTAGCTPIASVCTTPGATPGSACVRWTDTYRCGTSPVMRMNTVSLNSTHTTTSDVTPAPQCALPAHNPTCTIAETVNGIPTYTCRSEQSNCAAIATTAGCTLSASTCVSPMGGTAANCLLYEKSYSCPSSVVGATSTILDCGSSQFCTGGNCFNAGHVPDGDIGSAVIGHEISRQATIYADGNGLLFSGESNSCNHNPLGRCCSPKGGAVNNRSIGGNILVTAGGQAIAAGSAYMYDAASTAYNTARGIEAIVATGAGAAAGGYSMSAYGLTMTYTAATTAGAGGTFTFAFDPTTFAIAVAIMIVVELSSCEPEEKTLAMKNGAGLCRQSASSCNDLLCFSVRRTYCCFNSKLAKIVNTAAVHQLGRANNDCSGMTTTEFGMLDFSKIDMSEFTAEIMANLNLPTTLSQLEKCANGAVPNSAGTCADGSVPALQTVTGVDGITVDVNNSVMQRMQNYFTSGQQ